MGEFHLTLLIILLTKIFPKHFVHGLDAIAQNISGRTALHFGQLPKNTIPKDLST
jgi:hypothetical protein